MAEKIINLRKEKAVRIVKKILHILRIPLIAALAVAALLFCAKMLGSVAVSNITDSINSIGLAVSSGDGYPYVLEDFNVRELSSVDGRPLVIYKDSSLVLDSTADTMLSCQLPAADSKAVVRNGRVFVYSNSSPQYVIHGKTEKLAEGKEDGNIIAAALAKNGSFATSHSSEEAQSVLSVYNSRQKMIFRWNCSNERIADIALSDNGKRVAVIAIGTQDAEFYTRLIIFDVDETEPTADIRYNGTLMLRVLFASSNRIITAGDNKTVVHNRKGEVLDELAYSEDSIRAIVPDDRGNLLVAYSEYGGAKTGLVRFSRSGRKTCEAVVDGTPDCFAMRNGKIVVSDDNILTVYNSKGDVKETVNAESPVLGIELSSNAIYTFENGVICKY